MAFGLTIGTERSAILQTAIQDELMKRGYSPDADPVMAEYITIMIINNKTPAQISSELEDLIGADFDSSFVDWLFAEAAKGVPDSPDVPSSSTATAPAPTVAAPRDSPPHLPTNSDTPRRPPSGPRASAPLYQQALSQALPSTSPSAQKRTASARSPSPTGQGPSHGHPHKSRRTDLPTGPRAMAHGREVSGGSRSLLERVGPARNGVNGNGPPYGPDDIQARIDNITGGGGSPDMAMMMSGGFPGMGGMDMGMGMAGITNPLLLQEMMMNQMALMTQMAGAMGIMGAPGQMMNGFPMQQGMGGDMFNGGMGGMQQGIDGPGRGRGRGRGGSAGRGGGRGRGGHNGPSTNGASNAESAQAPVPTTPALVIAAPTPTPALVAAPAITSVPSSSSITSQQRPGFIPPVRPQSPTLCKFGLKCTNALCRYSHPSPVATAESGIVLSNEACAAGIQCKDKDCIKAHVSPAVLNPNAADQLKPNTYVPPAAPVPATHPHSPAQSTVPCRYGAACTRPNCTFAHPPRPNTNSVTTPCRFGAACTRAACPFQHPEGRVLPGTFHRGLSTSAPMVSVKTPEAGSMTGSGPNQSQNRSMTFNNPKASAAELERKLREMEEKKNEAEKAVAQAEAAAAGKKDDASKPVIISA